MVCPAMGEEEGSWDCVEIGELAGGSGNESDAASVAVPGGVRIFESVGYE